MSRMNIQQRHPTHRWSYTTRVDVVQVIEVRLEMDDGTPHLMGIVEARWPRGEVTARSYYTSPADRPNAEDRRTRYGVQPHEAATRTAELTKWIETRYEQATDPSLFAGNGVPVLRGGPGLPPESTRRSLPPRR